MAHPYLQTPEERERMLADVTASARRRIDGVRTIPASDITPAELRSWHVVEVSCTGCCHTRVMRHEPLRAGDRAAKKLSELRFRCGRCPVETEVRVTVVALPRNL
jgi:hypothetical protein